MVSGSLALLYFLLGFHGGRQGSGPDRGQSPVEWGDFPYVCPSIRLAPLGHPPRPEAQPGRPEARGDGNASHTYLFGLHSTLITHYLFLKHNLSDLGRTNKRNTANAIFEVLKDLTDSERSD